MASWAGYRRWYFETARDAGHVKVYSDGETSIVVASKAVYHNVHSLSGDLPQEQKSRSIAVLRQIGMVVSALCDDGMTLWYKATDSRRERVYKKALSRMGLNVQQGSVIALIRKGD